MIVNPENSTKKKEMQLAKIQEELLFPSSFFLKKPMFQKDNLKHIDS